MTLPDTLQSSTLFIAKPKRGKPFASIKAKWRFLVPLLTPLLILLVWHVITARALYPAFIIPPPADVARAFVEAMEDGRLPKAFGVTFSQVMIGLSIGALLGLSLGYVLGRLPILETLLAPLMIAFQSTPVVAYAPLLLIWFGSGHTSKIFTCAVIVFFPLLMNTLVGIRQIPASLKDVFRVLRANWWYTFTRLELPAALPVILTGFKTSATLSVIGAVVGEFVSAGDGLGTLVTKARFDYNTPLVYVAILTMTALALSLYTLVSLLEWRLLRWQRVQQG
jgi:NitT/TauT family transport system permease protein